MIRRLLVPDEYIKSVYDINLDELKKRGIKLIVFDIDNTLKTYDETIPSSKNKDFFELIKSKGMDVCFLSNGRKKRVKKYNEDINFMAIHCALKPLPYNLKKILKYNKVSEEEVVIVGDQIFTDVIAGKLSNVGTILVEPIKPKNTLIEKFKRMLEKHVLKVYNRKQ